MARKTYVLRDGKLVEKHLAAPKEDQHMILPDISPVKSPITGEWITTRPRLKAHMRQHEVTDASDYSPETRERLERERLNRFAGQTRQDRQERIEALKYALEKHHVR